MKNTIIILILFFCKLTHVSSQSIHPNSEISYEDKKILKITVPAKNELPGLHKPKHISFQYINNQIQTVTFQYSKSDSNSFDFLKAQLQGYSKFYDLEFIADSILLHRDYPDLVIPAIPHIKSEFLYDGRKRSSVFYISSIVLYKDSTAYGFTQDFEFPNDGAGAGLSVRLKSNVKDLKKNISMKLDKNSKSDSIIIELIMSRSGKIESSKLIYGDNTKLYNIVNNALIESAVWYPAMIYSSGVSIRVKARIYVHVDDNQQVSIKLPTKLLNFTGD